MSKLKDIHDDLEKDVDLTHIFPISKSKPKKLLWMNGIKDLHISLPHINLKWQKIVQFYKNRTHNFDWIVPQDKRNILDMNSGEISMSTKLQNIKNQISNYTPNLRLNSFYSIAIIIGILVLYIGSSRFIVENQVKSWYEKLSQIGEMKSNLDQIESQVSKSKINFLIAKAFFLPYYLIPTSEVNNWKLVINGWIQLTSTLKDLLWITKEVQDFVAKKWVKEVKFSQLFINIQPALVKAQKEIEWTIQNYQNLTFDNPELQKKLVKQIKNLQIGYNYISNINANFDTILDILGHNKEKKYLIVFQNSDEIRPTGWFMGSMAILGLFRWQITEFTPKDVYDLEWNLKKAWFTKEAAPEWINKITDSFWLRDANYFVNFDESSKKIKFFTENAGFPIDGIVYLNHSIILKFLKVTWAINFDKIGEKIDENNFSELISVLVESKKFKSWTLDTPKQVLFDFANKFLITLQEQKNYKQYIKILVQSLENREIVFYPFEQKQNEFAGNLWINGGINYFWTFDYDYPVFTSISWNKSDRYIKRSFEKYIKEGTDCSVETTFQIIQKHTFSDENEKKLQQEFKKFDITDTGSSLLQIQGKWINKQYVRVIIPKDAIIEKNKNITIQEYNNRKSLNFYTEVAPWNIVVFDISYTLQNKSCNQYTYKMYKQPWIQNYDIRIQESWREGKDNTYKNLENDFYYEVRK